MLHTNRRRKIISIILNEREYAESILANKITPKKPTKALSVLAKYFYSHGYRTDEIIKRLEEYILRIDENASLLKWQQVIEKYAKHAGRYPLIEIESVPVTQAELDIVASVPSKPLKRLAFTLLCIAKFYNLSAANNNNWVNKSDKEIFALANIRTSIVQQSIMINTLRKLGLIGYSKLVDNLNINVKFIDDNSDIILHISDFRNLGYQYLQYVGEPFFVECEHCGLLIKRTSNRQKYCSDCASEVDRIKSVKRWKESFKSHDAMQ